MTTFIVFLRAVNVGRSNMIKMKDLCVHFLNSGEFSLVKTHLQSGNIICQVSPHSSMVTNNAVIKHGIVDTDRLCDLIGGLIEEKFNCQPKILLRKIEELEQIIHRVPFTFREGNKVQVHFLDKLPADEGIRVVEDYDKGPEIVKVIDREVFVHYVEGIGRSKFNRVPLEKILEVSATARNLNTIRAVLQIAKNMTKKE